MSAAAHLRENGLKKSFNYLHTLFNPMMNPNFNDVGTPTEQLTFNLTDVALTTWPLLRNK